MKPLWMLLKLNLILTDTFLFIHTTHKHHKKPAKNNSKDPISKKNKNTVDNG